MTTARVLDVTGTVVRLGLAAVWLVSGSLKITDPIGSAIAVGAYDVLPGEAVGLVATVLPLLELALGVLLLAGIGTRLAGLVSAVLLAGFVSGLLQAWARGLSIDCGCFGGGGPVAPGQERYGGTLLRDLGFLALALWLSVRPRTLLAVDRIWDPAPAGGPGTGDRTSGRRAPAGAEGDR
ncbi:MauE/DoxX family redox-associated membrane protein [Pseudonocardia nantongensis]|uniref:MauE/DoxX family redox-associated membrane protein n=1 Tax=Pseudonocardia nantongensis TaxID=1181885 RepID=UPI00397BAFAB